MLDVHTEAQLLQNCPLHFDHLSLRIDIRCVKGNGARVLWTRQQKPIEVGRL